MITAMTQATPEDTGRKTQVVTVGSKTIVIRELVDLQMMHLMRYANILQRDDIAVSDKLDAMARMIAILNSCAVNDEDRRILAEAEETGEISLADMVSFIKAFQEPEDTKPTVRRGRVPARRK